MKAKAERLCLDKYNHLPQNIIDNILCLVPIKDAVRTSILSRDWRYKWVTIPKLVFNENDMRDTTTLFDSEKKELDSKFALEGEEFMMKDMVEREELDWKCVREREAFTMKQMDEREKVGRKFQLERGELVRKFTLEAQELTRKFEVEEKELIGKFTRKIFNAIHQVLLQHQGPILEFSLSITCFEIKTCVELDQIVTHLARNNESLKKFTLDLGYTSSYRLPLSVFSLHQISDLYLRSCTFHFDQRFSGFGSITSLYLESDSVSKKALLHLLSNYPLKSFTLKLGLKGKDEDIPIIELCSCLPMIEYLSLDRCYIECSAQDRVTRELPTPSVNLKYLHLNMGTLLDDYGLCFIGLVLRSSPNLETFQLEIGSDDAHTELVLLEDCSDIWLEHLKLFEFNYF